MGDWQELGQAVFLGLVFAFLIAKLISTVVSFRDENLRIVRAEDLPESAAQSTSTVHIERVENAGGGGIEDEPVREDIPVREDEDDDDDEWEGIESTELDEMFSAATAFVAATATDRSSPSVSNDVQLQLYGLYKIATEGPCTAPQPSALKLTARAKWNAWQKMGTMPPEEAMQKYIMIVTELYPSWVNSCSMTSSRSKDEGSASASKGTMGPVFSSFIHEEEHNKETNLDALHVYAREGNVNGLLARLESGFSVNIIDSEGRTPLHWAVDRGNTEVVEILLGKDADVNAKDSEGQTPLHYALLCDRLSIAEVLIKHGADPEARDNDGHTPRELVSLSSPEFLPPVLSPVALTNPHFVQ